MRRLAFATALLIATPALADDQADMAKAATSFYTTYKAVRPSGVPEAADRAKFAPFITPALETLLKKGEEAEIKYAKANKDSPPMMEGDLFSSLFEGANAFSIGACSGDGKTGKCAANLSYTDPSGKSAWVDTVYLVKTASGWKVDDIGYGGTWDFGNKGRMTETLKHMLTF